MSPNKVVSHYEIIRKLGAGAFGVVYHAYDTKLLRPVVLKLLQSGGDTDPVAGKASITREARLASAIDHPNVCSIYEVQEDSDEPFIVMQYVPGRTLKELIEDRVISQPAAVSIGLQVAEGLSAAHALEILHRDLKPANIMVTEGGMVKILDFGLAKKKPSEDALDGIPGHDTQVGCPQRSSPAGSVGFLAPERFIDRPSTERADVFSLGVVFYTMATGFHPFAVRGSENLARAIQFSEPVSPRKIRPDLAPSFEHIILKALVKNPNERFASAIEVRDALRELSRAMGLEAGLRQSQSRAVTSAQRTQGKKSGWLSNLARLTRPTRAPGERTVLVLPLESEGQGIPEYFGAAAAESIATRLARLPPVHAVATWDQLDPNDLVKPLRAGKLMGASHVVSGRVVQDERGLHATWRITDVKSEDVAVGNQLEQKETDLVRFQDALAQEILVLSRARNIFVPAAEDATAEVDDEVTEAYVEARAFLSQFGSRSLKLEDLARAREKLREALRNNPNFAPAHSAAGVANLNYARSGFGGKDELQAARKHFERALALDDNQREARVYRIYTMMAMGEKEAARHAAHHVLEAHPRYFAGRMAAASLLRIDGAYAAADVQLKHALPLEPANAHLVYNARARLLHYQDDLDAAQDNIERALALQPGHLLIRTSLGYVQGRRQDFDAAVQTLREVIAEEPTLRMAYPTLAMYLLRIGKCQEATQLINAAVVAAAESDGEIAYRLASYHATAAQREDALHWLRKAIYLGNENYPWFARNPAWEPLAEDEDLAALLNALEIRYRRNMNLWERLLG